MGETKSLIKSETVTLKDLLSEKTYIIPEYQRPYEWSHSEIDKVLENILSVIDSEEPEEKNDFMFFGPLQFNQEEGKETIEIVDGQQRLTTFLLIEAALNQKKPSIEGKKLECGNCTIIYRNNVKEEKFNDNYNYLFDKLKDQKIRLENIWQNILFVKICTKCASLEKMLKIFSAMNMEGLPLQSEDIFKVKYSDLFPENSSKMLTEINKKYEHIYNYNNDSKLCDLSEYDIMDTFKLFIISCINCNENSQRKTKWAKCMNASPILFFTEQFDEISKIKDKIGVETFKNIADTVINTQTIIDNKNREKFNQENIIWFARELIGESRYRNLQNIVFYLAYKLSDKKGNPTDAEVELALKISEMIWQYCSIFRSASKRTLLEVYEKMIEIISMTDDEINEDSVQKSLNEGSHCYEDYYPKEFNKMLNGDCFNGNLPNLMVQLSYFDDCLNYKEKCTIGDIKKYVFYRNNHKSEEGFGKQTNLDIEHIISKCFRESCNSIGNIMYLEKNINRNIGKRLANNKLANKDFDFKCDLSEIKIPEKDDSSSYYNSHLICVKKVISDYNVNGRIWDIECCEKRKSAKIKFIKELYAGNGFDLDCE